MYIYHLYYFLYRYQQNADAEDDVEQMDIIDLSQRLEPKCDALHQMCLSMVPVFCAECKIYTFSNKESNANQNHSFFII